MAESLSTYEVVDLAAGEVGLMVIGGVGVGGGDGGGGV